MPQTYLSFWFELRFQLKIYLISKSNHPDFINWATASFFILMYVDNSVLCFVKIKS